jgi:hypothetical protein
MVYCTWKNHAFGLGPSSNVFRNIAFWKLDIFPSSGKIMAAATLLGPIERGCLNQRLSLALSKRPNRVEADIILPENGNRSSFQNVMFLETLHGGQSPKT